MRKLPIILGIAFVCFLFGLSFSSAQFYGGYMGGYNNDYYNSYSYHSSRTSGYNGMMSTRTASYDKMSYDNYLPDGTRVSTTRYVKTTTETPQYYRGYYNNMPYYTPSYNYRPWYQKYWNQPNYYQTRSPYYYRW